MLTFVTKNRNKFEEVKPIVEAHGIEIERRNIPYIEIQAEDLGEIAKPGVQQACTLIDKPCLIEDAGLFVEELGGFPGPYSSHLFEKLGIDGLLTLMERVENRRAEFRSAIGYCEPGSTPRLFKSKVSGLITREPRGSHGFGFDPLFVPDGGGGKTFAEMETKMKNAFSHRAKAIEKFVNWYVRERKAVSD